MSIQKHSTGVNGSAIYGESANINYFLKTDLEADSVGSVTNISYTAAAHSRRKYVGDSSPASIPQQTRTVIQDPGRRNGSATPGKEMILDDGTERRSFTFTGNWTDIHAFLVGNVAMDLAAYSPSARYDIKAAGEQVAAARIK